MPDPLAPERATDRIIRSWYRGAMYFMALACMAWGCMQLLDENAGVAAAAAALALVWVVAARLIFRY